MITLFELGKLGEPIEVIAIAISLVYVAIQIRQGAKSNREAAGEPAMNVAVRLQSLIPANRDVAAGCPPVLCQAQAGA